jgi:hypothetical protein
MSDTVINLQELQFILTEKADYTLSLLIPAIKNHNWIVVIKASEILNLRFRNYLQCLIKKICTHTQKNMDFDGFSWEVARRLSNMNKESEYTKL